MSVVRTTQLMAGLLWRRFVNRMMVGILRKANPVRRTGTGRKRVGSVIFMLFVTVWMAFTASFLTAGALRGVLVASGPMRDSQGRIELSTSGYDQLEKIQTKGKTAENCEREASTIFFNTIRGSYGERHTAQTKELVRHYHEKGLSGFVGVREDENVFFPSSRAWQRPDTRAALVNAVGIILLILGAARFSTTLGTANQDLGKVEWSTEWLFTFPVPASHLLAAQILGHALVDPFSWLGTLPALWLVFYSAGFGWWSGLSALCGTLYLGLLMASLRVCTETFLRKRLKPAPLKNLQALFGLLGTGLLLALFLLSKDGAPSAFLADMARRGSLWFTINPLSLPAAFFSMPAALALALQLVAGAAAVAIGVKLSAWLVRDGLVTASNAYVGKRKSSGTLPRSFLPGGIIGKDIRLLLRDRNFLVQSLVAPLLMIGFQIFNGGMLWLINKSFQNAAAFAYGLGAYVLVTTALSILAVEGNSLWMLFALPVPLHRIMLRKTLLWAGCALVYTLIALGICAYGAHALRWSDLGCAGMACVGVAISAFIASGIGMLGTDPLDQEVKRRIRPSTVYLYMVLCASYGRAICSPSVWTQFGQVVLFSALAYALWQKVRDRSPFLLDPVSAPPPQVSLATGLIAALAFFVLQGVFGTLVSLFLIDSHSPLGLVVTLSFSLAGGLVMAFTLISFWRTPWALFPPTFQRAEGVAKSLGIGLVLGILVGAIGLAYLAAMKHVPALKHFLDEALKLKQIEGWWLALLAVGAAPVFEEFIFRGLVFRGMRRSLPLSVSIVASAAIFTLCHPAVSAAPVFVMACLAAWAFERTGRLATPILVHLVYNAIVVFLSRSVF